jgi:hypothetical protein
VSRALVQRRSQRQNHQFCGRFISALTIHTCELNGVNPFDYLNELQRHAEELKQAPSEWMPWNYRETLARTGALLEDAA